MAKIEEMLSLYAKIKAKSKRLRESGNEKFDKGLLQRFVLKKLDWTFQKEYCITGRKNCWCLLTTPIRDICVSRSRSLSLSSCMSHPDIIYSGLLIRNFCSNHSNTK